MKVTLTESQLHNLVHRCVNEALRQNSHTSRQNMNEAWYNDWNDFKSGAKNVGLGLSAATSLMGTPSCSSQDIKANSTVSPFNQTEQMVDNIEEPNTFSPLQQKKYDVTQLINDKFRHADKFPSDSLEMSLSDYKRNCKRMNIDIAKIIPLPKCDVYSLKEKDLDSILQAGGKWVDLCSAGSPNDYYIILLR